MKSTKATMTARAIAADRILDRAYGKAPQAVGVISAPSRPIEQLSDASCMQSLQALNVMPIRTKLIDGELVAEEEAEAPRPLDVDTNVGTAERDGEKSN
jgi:hypothetical protein